MGKKKKLDTKAERNDQNHSGGNRAGAALLVPKVIGYDGEVGNFIEGLYLRDGTGKDASRALLAEIRGIPGDTIHRDTKHTICGCESSSLGSKWPHMLWYPPRDSYEDAGEDTESGSEEQSEEDKEGVTTVKVIDPRDHHRIYLPENGGCIYIDLDHIELCLPEVRSAYDHVACWHAMLRILRRALDEANQKQPEGRKIVVLLNNSDGNGNSYGSHLNFLLTERCRANIFERKMHYLLFLAAYQVSSIIFTGQGKVGSENGTPDIDFQLSQRADFFEQLTGPQTTYARPIVNSRDEAHCGSLSLLRHSEESAWAGMARLHVIFYDSTLCHVATLLKVGVMQIVLAMIEAGFVNPHLILEDPVKAVVNWSHDLSFRAAARTFLGKRVTAIELQRRFLEEAAKFAARGGCDGIVPRAGEIIDLWADTLSTLESGDLPSLARRLDWALKLLILKQTLENYPHLHWKHPAIKRLDHVYSSLDPSEGLFWIYDRKRLIERLVSHDEITHFTANPPEDTRAWTRAMLLRRAGRDRVESIDWDRIRFRPGTRTSGSIHRKFELDNPLAFGRLSTEPIFQYTDSLDDTLDALEKYPRMHLDKKEANSHEYS